MASKTEKLALELRQRMTSVSRDLAAIQSDLEDIAADLEEEIDGLESEDEPDTDAIDALQNMLDNVNDWAQACELAQEKLDT